MRRAIIAEICANGVALQAVLRDCEKQRVDEIVCLGSIVGYGPDCIECIDLIRANCRWSLRGRLDDGLVHKREHFNAYVRGSLDRCRRELTTPWYAVWRSTQRLQWLESVPIFIREDKSLYVNGTPDEPVGGLLTDGDFIPFEGRLNARIQRAFEHTQRLCSLAATHRPGVGQENEAFYRPPKAGPALFNLKGGNKYLINPGSVGQPRDGNPRSAYIVHDTQADCIEFVRVAYPVEESIRRFQKAGLHDNHYKRLLKGL